MKDRERKYKAFSIELTDEEFRRFKIFLLERQEKNSGFLRGKILEAIGPAQTSARERVAAGGAM